MALKYPSGTWDAQLSMDVLNYTCKQMEAHPSPPAGAVYPHHSSPPSTPAALLCVEWTPSSFPHWEQEGNWTCPKEAIDPRAEGRFNGGTCNYLAACKWWHISPRLQPLAIESQPQGRSINPTVPVPQTSWERHVTFFHSLSTAFLQINLVQWLESAQNLACKHLFIWN